MKKEIKIALCGEMRTGKDTVAEYLEEKYILSPFAFGDELKKDFHLQNPHIPRFPKPVKGYQLHGQYKRYTHGEDIWINLCFDQINKIKKVAQNYNITGSEAAFSPLITDLRQPNELERLREEGYIIIRVEAPLEVRIERMKAAGDEFDENNLNFETENHVKDFDVDHVIVNDGTLEELYYNIDALMLDFIGEKYE